MSPRTHLFVACANGKRIPPDPRLRLRHAYDSPPSPLADHVASWTSRLETVDSKETSVANLYKGEHWAQVRAFAAQNTDLRVWVCSAGYGLVGYETRLKSYSATFAPNGPDSVQAVI